MQSNNITSDKIIRQLKGLRTHLQPDEEPLFTVPAIWDSGQEQRSVPCDVVVTNQRIFGYYFVTFPRERLFLDAPAQKPFKQRCLRAIRISGFSPRTSAIFFSRLTSS